MASITKPDDMAKTNGLTLSEQQMIFDALTRELQDLKVIASDEQDEEVRELAQEGIERIGKHLASMQARPSIVEGAVEL